MTIWAPKLQDHACTKIPYKGYEISIAMDDSCGAFEHYSRSKIAVFHTTKGNHCVSHLFFDGAIECDATAENLIAIFKKIDELEKGATPAETWVLNYPREGRSHYVGPFPTKQAAWDFPIESEVCSVSRLYTPEQDMEHE